MSNIDNMIEILSETPPHFLDITKKEHNIAFEYMSHLFLLSKILCQQNVISQVGIDAFSDNFLEMTNNMIENLNEEIAEECYNYVNEFYTHMVVYLEGLEEYEMCQNFLNFIKTFNHKIDTLNGI